MRHAMEELMRFAMKILLPAALLATAMGTVVAYSFYHRQQPAVPIAKNTPGPATTAQPSKDDPLKAGTSWTRWPSVTDY